MLLGSELQDALTETVKGAVPLVESVIPPPSPSEMRRNARTAMQKMVSDGYVSIHDAGLGSAEMAVLEALERDDELPLRVYAMLSVRDEELPQTLLCVMSLVSPQLTQVRSISFLLVL